MKKRKGLLRRGRTNLKGHQEGLPNSETLSTEKAFKTLRYRLQSKQEEIRLASYTRAMQRLLILKELRPGEAAKILFEIILNNDLITTEHLIEYRNQKRKKK